MDIDKENTVRILKGQDKIQRLRCRMNWHRWTAWAINERHHDFQMPVMRCYCADCGIVRMQQPYSSSTK